MCEVEHHTVVLQCAVLSFLCVLQRLDWEELTATSTSMQTVERINQGAPKPSSQVNSHTQELSHTLINTHTHTHTHTHSLQCRLLLQVNRTSCVTTSARCSCSCALWTGPAASPVTPARPTATTWRAAVFSVRPSSRRPVPCWVGAETHTRRPRSPTVSGGRLITCARLTCRLWRQPVEGHAAETGTDQSVLQHHGGAALQEWVRRCDQLLSALYCWALCLIINAVLCLSELSYRVDMVTWNQYLRWGVVYIRLHSGRSFTEARIDQ